MSRVIQDSDDDLEGSPSPVKEQEQPGGSTADKAASSSGDLLRGIHAAQDALADASTIPNMDGVADVPARSTSVEMSSSKRKKSITTYGSSNKRSKTIAYDEAARVSAMRLGEQSPRGTERCDWLPPTLQNDFAEHDPNTLFSEPSSTVPDNTMSQQRIIQQALESNRPGDTISTQNKSDHTQNSDSSIPWSACKDTQKELPPSSRMRQNDPIPLLSTQSPSSQKRRSQTFGTPNRSSQTPQRASHDEGALGDSTTPVNPLVSSHRSRRTKTLTPPHQSNAFLKPVAFLSEIEVQDKPVKDARQQVTEPDGSSRSKRRKLSSGSPNKPEPTPDELWIDIPKEQYKPRASRSRSARVTDDEYLQAVQQTLKPKSRRRKTTNDLQQPEQTPHVTRDDAVLSRATNRIEGAVNEAENEAMDTRDGRDDENKENDAPGTISLLGSAKAPAPIAKPVLVEVAIPPPLSTNTKRKPLIEPEHLTVKGTVIASPALRPPQQVPPSSAKRKSKACRSQTAATPGFSQRRKVFDSDDSDSEISPVKSIISEKDELGASPAPKTKAADTPPPPPPPAPAEKKRGSGRPRKSDNAKAGADPLSEAVDVPSRASTNHSENVGIQEDVARPQEPLETNGEDHNIAENTSTNQAKAAESSKLSEGRKSMPPSSTPEQPQQVPNTLLKTPESKNKAKSPVNHSSISKGKVPYRVGLSRRSRIAPLLRVIKK